MILKSKLFVDLNEILFYRLMNETFSNLDFLIRLFCLFLNVKKVFQALFENFSSLWKGFGVGYRVHGFVLPNVCSLFES